MPAHEYLPNPKSTGMKRLTYDGEMKEEKRQSLEERRAEAESERMAGLENRGCG